MQVAPIDGSLRCELVPMVPTSPLSPEGLGEPGSGALESASVYLLYGNNNLAYRVARRLDRECFPSSHSAEGAVAENCHINRVFGHEMSM